MMPLERYNQIVENDTQTCFACPTQYEGTLRDGRYFYFRYRYGWANLGVASESVDAAVEAAFRGSNGWSAGKGIGDTLDGVLGWEEYRKVFVELFDELLEENHAA